ncbi:alpha/beta hydrolase [Microbacterium sp. A84]|uniref:alpha/beta hydrolase n=1 Tax=Microbacterium sp. A84 TaxID=3450715 RepID=UPI003F43730E
MSDNLTLDADATRWAPDTRNGLPLLVLLHGYGADEHDLFGLVPYLPEGIAVASIAAPLTPPWPAPGRSWYPIDGLNGRDPDAVTHAARAVLDWLDAHAGDVPTAQAGESPRIALLGFSQGAAVSLQALRLDAARFGAVVALSGYASPGDLPDDEALQESRPSVFWGRGTNDDVIPAPLIAHTSQWLPSHSELTGRVYPGLTHSISEAELLDVKIFLEKWRDDSAG